MEAKDFRIGNFVRTKKPSLKANDSDIEKIYFEIEEIKKDVVQFNGFLAGELYSDLNPIKLTDEWVRNFGFDDSDYKKGYTGIEIKLSNGMITDFVLTKPHAMDDWQTYYAYELRSYRFVDLNYVHELQNLFFTITGFELKLNEKTKMPRANDCQTFLS